MANITLDKWSVPTPTTENKPMIINDAHAHYLYEQSIERQIEKMYNAQIKKFLEDEKREKEAHKEYTEKNYIRVGGN